MTMRQTVVLCGNSLFISSVAASLSSEPGLITFQVDDLPALDKLLMSVRPAVVLFDLDAPHDPNLISLLQTYSDLVLMGLHLSSDQMLILSGQQVQIMTAHDLAAVIRRHTHDYERDGTMVTPDDARSTPESGGKGGEQRT